MKWSHWCNELVCASIKSIYCLPHNRLSHSIIFRINRMSVCVCIFYFFPVKLMKLGAHFRKLIAVRQIRLMFTIKINTLWSNHIIRRGLGYAFMYETWQLFIIVQFKLTILFVCVESDHLCETREWLRGKSHSNQWTNGFFFQKYIVHQQPQNTWKV